MARTVEMLNVGKRELKLSNLGKVLYPEAGFTKGQLIDYYIKIGPAMLPYLKGRAVTRKRYPEGVDKAFFYEKNCPSYKPEWMDTAMAVSRNERGRVDYCVVNELASLVWLANLAAIELHTSLAKADAQQKPSFLVYDLDPGPPADVLDAVRVGLKLRKLLKEAKLESFAKTSGGKGIHVYVPLNTSVTFDDTKAFARTMAEALEKRFPDEVTTSMRKDVRGGKVFIDWSQNDEHKTTVCVYSMRARGRPTVSVPVTWTELESALRKKDTARITFEAPDVIKRVEKDGDLFEAVLKVKQRLGTKF